MDAHELGNPSASMTEDCQISSSQKEILSHCPFPEDPFKSPGDRVPPTLPEAAQDSGKDMGSPYAFDFRPCTRHKAVQTDDETQNFDDFTRITSPYVNLSDDSDLGSPLAELIQMTEYTMVAGCSYRNDRPSVIEISNCETDKFQVPGRELFPKDSIDVSPHKRTKTSEQILGSKSLQSCSGIEPQKIRANLQTCEGDVVSNNKSPCNFAVDPLPQQNIQIGNEMPLGVSDKKKYFSGISVEKNLGSGENLGSYISQSEIARSVEECVENIESRGQNCETACTGEGNNAMDEIAETSEQKGGDEQHKLMMLSPSILAFLKDMAKRKNENGKDFDFVFDVFKCLTQLASTKKDSLDNINWLELAKSKGISFPTPRWRKETNN